MALRCGWPDFQSAFSDPGNEHPQLKQRMEMYARKVSPREHACDHARSVLESWVKPCGTRLGIRKDEQGAVRLPKILVLIICYHGPPWAAVCSRVPPPAPPGLRALRVEVERPGFCSHARYGWRQAPCRTDPLHFFKTHTKGRVQIPYKQWARTRTIDWRNG